MMRRAMAALVAVGPAAIAAAACPPTARDGRPLSSGPVAIAWRADPPRLAARQAFAIRVRLCPDTAHLVSLDATMPEHGHGMNYRPTLTALGGGQWRADGLLWHMSGRWELRFEVADGEQTWRLRDTVLLP